MTYKELTRRNFIKGGVGALASSVAIPSLYIPSEADAQVGGQRYYFVKSPYEDKKNGVKISLNSQKNDFIGVADNASENRNVLFNKSLDPLVVFEGHPQRRDYMGIKVGKDESARIEFERENNYGLNNSAYFSVHDSIFEFLRVRRGNSILPLFQFERGRGNPGNGGSGTISFDPKVSGEVSFRSSVSAIDRQRGFRPFSATLIVRVDGSQFEYLVSRGSAQKQRNPDFRRR